ncbi:MAG TPA: GDYXXLXY domain-containing protein [Polyangiaceae bacterium]
MRASLPWLAALAASVLAELGVPTYVIVQHERVMRTGETFRFRMAPVDPYDAFRGRYIALRFEQHCAPVAAASLMTWADRTVDVPVETGPDGFARLGIVDGSAKRGQAYLTLHSPYPCPNADAVQVEIPFDRFYLEEDIAPAAELVYREHTGDAQRDAYASVRVRDGIGVIENVYIGGKPIADVVRERGSKRE